MKKLLLFCLLLTPITFQANVLDNIQHEISKLTNKIPFLKSAINSAENKYNSMTSKINGIINYFKEFSVKINIVIQSVDHTIAKIKNQFIPAIENDIDTLSKTSVEVNKSTIFVPIQFIDQVMQPVDTVENMILNISNSGLAVSDSTVAAGDVIHHFGKALEFVGVKKAENKTKEIKDTIHTIHATIVDVIAKEHEAIQASSEVKQELKFIAQRLAQTLQKFNTAGVFDVAKIKAQVASIIAASGVKRSNITIPATPPTLLNMA